jgi:hypothetical protein
VEATELDQQFARTPYAVSFETGSRGFTLVTLHVLYGEAPADRVDEPKEIATSLAEWPKREKEWSENLLALGDFNVDRRGEGLRPLVRTRAGGGALPVGDGSGQLEAWCEIRDLPLYAYRPVGLTIRDARPEDAQALARLIEQLGYPTSPDAVVRRVDLLASSAADRLVVAELEGRVVGLASVHISLSVEYDEPSAKLSAIVVDSDYRRRGSARHWSRR